MPSVRNAPAKRATKKITKAATKRVTKRPPNIYVVSARSKMFLWKPYKYTTDKAEADRLRLELEKDSMYGPRAAKIDLIQPIV